MKSDEHDEENAGRSLLELLLVVAENIRLLVLRPLVVGLPVWLGMRFLPVKCTSQSYLSLASDSAKAVQPFMRSSAVPDSVLAKFPSRFKVAERGRDELSKTFRFVAAVSGEKSVSTILKLEVDSESAERAQALSNALIDSWLASTRPAPGYRQELERKQKLNQAGLDAVFQLIARLTGETAKLMMPTVHYDLATSKAQLFQLRNGYAGANAAIELTLRGTTRDVVFAAPTLPSEPTNNERSSTVVLAAVASGFVSVLWLLLRQAWTRGALSGQKAGQVDCRFEVQEWPRLKASREQCKYV